jgi:exonuclease VII large subunit
MERGARLDGERRLLQVSDVLRAIEDQFHTAFPRRIWVFGSLRGLRSSTYDIPDESAVSVDAFVLVEDTEDGMRTLPCELGSEARRAIDDSLRRLHDVAVDDLLVEGHFIRAGGLLSYDPERHCAIFEVTALDPAPTAAWLADRREQVRSAASSARLSERQRDMRVPAAPSSIALVAPAGDPALRRSHEALAACGFAVDVKVYAPDVSGSAAGDRLANGLREAALAGHDLVLLLRQDGRPLSLAPYDSEAVVRAVASAATPILTGLGSPEEPAAAEEVAHQCYASAQEATESVVRRLERAAEDVEWTVRTVSDEGGHALRRAARRLEETRLNLAEDFREAHQRAERIRARRVLRLRIAAGLLALVVVAVAVVTKIWPVLGALVIPLALAVAAPRLRAQRRTTLTVTEYSFSEALSRLSDIGRQLREVSDPDDVLRLEADADTLADHCRALLRRPRALRTAGQAPERPAWPAVGADGSVIGAAEPADPAGRPAPDAELSHSEVTVYDQTQDNGTATQTSSQTLAGGAGTASPRTVDVGADDEARTLVMPKAAADQR